MKLSTNFSKPFLLPGIIRNFYILKEISRFPRVGKKKFIIDNCVNDNNGGNNNNFSIYFP